MMHEIVCPHCGKPVGVDQTAASERVCHEQELEILRLQAELEQICTRFELQLQQKDREIAIYQEMAEQFSGGKPLAPDCASGKDGICAAMEEIDQSIARLVRAKEMLQMLGA